MASGYAGDRAKRTGASSSLAVQEISMEKLHLPDQPNGPDPLLHTCYKHMPERIRGGTGEIVIPTCALLPAPVCAFFSQCHESPLDVQIQLV